MRNPALRKMVKYASVSLVGVVSTTVMLTIFHGVLGMGAQPANISAVMISSIPAYLLNRSWVWGKSGKSHFRREVLPFWAFALAGLALSTLFVGLVEQRTEATIPVLAANLSGFGLLWVARFFVLDRLLFKEERQGESILQQLAEEAPLA